MFWLCASVFSTALAPLPDVDEVEGDAPVDAGADDTGERDDASNETATTEEGIATDAAADATARTMDGPKSAPTQSPQPTPPPPGVWQQGPKPHQVVPSAAAIQREGDVSLVSTPNRRRRLQRSGSPQRFGFELKFGPFLPEVDRNYTGDGLGPYAQVFGQTDDDGRAIEAPKNGLLTALGFEYQFVYLAGPFSIGLQGSFFRDKAKALLTEPVGDEVRSEADETSFSTLPLALLLGYRFEYLADRYRWVPFVPYARGGVVYGFWWARDSTGNIAVADGDKGRGGVWGWQVNAGGMLRLDFIEPETSKEFDRTSGVNHTYLFGEYQLSRIDGFGRAGSMSIGDGTWMVGFAFEL